MQVIFKNEGPATVTLSVEATFFDLIMVTYAFEDGRKSQWALTRQEFKELSKLMNAYAARYLS
jgi:hypothetical protein